MKYEGGFLTGHDMAYELDIPNNVLFENNKARSRLASLLALAVKTNRGLNWMILDNSNVLIDNYGALFDLDHTDEISYRIEIYNHGPIHFVPSKHRDFFVMRTTLPIRDSEVTDQFHLISSSISFHKTRMEITAACHHPIPCLVSFYICVLMAKGMSLHEAQASYSARVMDLMGMFKDESKWDELRQEMMDIEATLINFLQDG